MSLPKVEPILIEQEGLRIRPTRPGDFSGIIELCREVYPKSRPWTEDQLASHLDVFPEGQLVAVDADSDRVQGMAASLVVHWDDYDIDASWRKFTDAGWFTNHDPETGRTLYGAEVMVDPDARGLGVGKLLYEGRRELVRRLGLRRIRAGARLRGYSQHAKEMSVEEYVDRVVSGEYSDPTLSFQLSQGFQVIAVVQGYLKSDPESLGYAAVIEWMNDRLEARAEDTAGRSGRWERSGGAG